MTATSRHVAAVPESQLDGLDAETGEPFAWIETAADGTWSPAEPESGLFAALLPVQDAAGEVIDVVAWDLTGKGSPWWLRTGAATHLGDWWLERCIWRQKCLRLVPTPREWLADRGEAVCILDWRANIRELLAGVPEVVTTHPALRERLERALAEPQNTVPRVA